MSKIIHEILQKAERKDIQANPPSENLDSPTEYDPSEAIDVLKEALRLIFSRPNKDNMVEKLLPPVRADLKSYDAYYDSLYDLVVEAVAGLNQKIPVVYKSTYIFVLENIMSEFRPQLKTEKDIQKIFIYIRDSDVKVPDDVRLDRKLRSMFKSRNPSDTARSILEIELPREKEKEKKGFWQRLFG
ncbi:MAG: hypothetical protein H6625_12870 [Bdellovibrionaceae bacterium]|nr:hypothetical protein [Pseudobdellovibrionaceae bacterium]